jgi:hypothetical protein
MQYLPLLESNGVEVCIEHLFDDGYLEALYRGQRDVRGILVAYKNRIRSLLKRTDADVIWLQKEALPWVPAAIEQSLLPRNIPLIVDYDDAVFHRYDGHSSALIRKIMSKKIAQVMGRANLVVVGNDYLRDYALFAGARSVEVVPTVIDADAYAPRSMPMKDETVTVGWVGTPETWKSCVSSFLPEIQSALAGLDAHLMAVGAGSAANKAAGVINREWSENREIGNIQEMDIGIMPLPNKPWMRGKCGYKLIQYMACGLPVIASPVGANRDIVDHGVNGLLAATPEEWVTALETLVNNIKLRQQMGARARVLVQEQYSLQVQGPRIVDLLKSLSV